VSIPYLLLLTAKLGKLKRILSTKHTAKSLFLSSLIAAPWKNVQTSKINHPIALRELYIIS
jgi:hypothetical protein